MQGLVRRQLEQAVSSLLVLVSSVACGRHSHSAVPSVTRALKPAPLTRLTTSNLFDAYAGGGADASYRGKRYTLVGSVVSASMDAGVQQVVLGSKLAPVVATGVDPGAALSLVADSEIEIDCTVTGATAEIPQVDCGPNGLPRAVSPPP